MCAPIHQDMFTILKAWLLKRTGYPFPHRHDFTFRPYAESLLAVAGVPAQPKRNRKGLPLHWPCAALRVPSLRHACGGTSRRAVPGPSLLTRLLPRLPLQRAYTRPAGNGAFQDQDHKPDHTCQIRIKRWTMSKSQAKKNPAEAGFFVKRGANYLAWASTSASTRRLTARPASVALSATGRDSP